jgi:hypothetical protein
MAEQKHPSDPLENDEPDPTSARSSVVFCSDPADVRAGFAIALKLMGFDTPIPHVEDRSLPKPKERPDE